MVKHHMKNYMVTFMIINCKQRSGFLHAPYSIWLVTVFCLLAMFVTFPRNQLTEKRVSKTYFVVFSLNILLASRVWCDLHITRT